ncbi:MAG: HD domain-containing protein [Lachnospiraceae bacterium]
MRERLEQQIQFIVEIDKAKRIMRQTYLSDGQNKENDAEHSWHMAIMALLLREYASEEVDVLRVIYMVLIHDIVEIDAGDTFAYDEKAMETKEARELAAADRIFNLLPPEQASDLRVVWDEFEDNITPEAHYAHLLDDFQPFLLNLATGGKGWVEHAVHKQQIYKRNQFTGTTSPEVWQYMKEKIEEQVRRGNIIDE